MTTVQIVGIAVASAVVLLLVIALLVTRRRGEREDAVAAPPAEPTGSFLDAPPTDTLGKLGKAEHEPGERSDSQLDFAPIGERPAGSPAAAGRGLGLDWGPGGADEHEAGADPLAPPTDSKPSDDTATTGEIGVPVHEKAGEGASRMVPLSDVIVTTSEKLVDLNDVEVRRMLTDLVTFEIDQAAEYRQQGQSVDAVLQLTEAEKICNALGLQDTAERIRRMMADLKA